MKVIEYLEGKMSFEEREAFEKELEYNEELKAEYLDYVQMYKHFEEVKFEQPSPSLRSNFENLLEREIQVQKEGGESKVLRLRSLRNAAAVAAVLLIGILVGQNWTQRDYINRFDNQTAQLLEEMKSNMNSPSVSGRIEAVQVSQKFDTPESSVLSTLITTLEQDESPNVRLAAAEALNRFASNEEVRASFVKQLSIEKDPFVLIALINTLSEQKEKKAIDPLEELTNAMDVAKFIKDEAHLGLIKIEKI